MEQEFVPYTEALELKAIGFDEPCAMYWSPEMDGSMQMWYHQDKRFDEAIGSQNSDNAEWVTCTAPLYQQAFSWFRDEHKLFGQVNVCTYFIYDMSNNDGFHPTLKMIKEYDRLCNNYEESELECLKKLIEIVKNK
jgi:hypothetical protein